VIYPCGTFRPAADDEYEPARRTLTSRGNRRLANDVDTQDIAFGDAGFSGPRMDAALRAAAHSYEPDAASGVDWFTSRAGDGVSFSPLGVATILVAADADVPVAMDDEFSLPVGGMSLSVAAPGVLANDSDGDGEPLAAVLVDAAIHGTVELSADGAFVYARPATFTGVDRFTYRVWDGAQYSATAEVLIHVPNTPPVAIGDAYATAEDAVLTVSAVEGVLADGRSRRRLSYWIRRCMGLTAADGSFDYARMRTTGSDSFRNAQRTRGPRTSLRCRWS
jgi:hypothetical protein